jgi:hypothetical protein
MATAHSTAGSPLGAGHDEHDIDGLRGHGRERLDSWKDIASYLGRDVSTAQRWEKREGMPVHRHLHSQRGSVYAYRAELDTWWQTRRGQLEADTAPTDDTSVPASPVAWSRRAPVWGALGLLAGATLASLVPGGPMRRPATEEEGSVVRFQIPAPPDSFYDQVPAAPEPAVSPDGRQIATVGLGGDRVSRLWIHSLDSERARMIPGTDGVESPFWSPDGRFVAFAANRRLMRVAATRGPAETITALPPSRAQRGGKVIVGGSWSSRGEILFGDSGSGRLYLVGADGGQARAVTTLDS